MMALLAIVTKGDPGVIKRAGRAIAAVNTGMKRRTRFRKKPGGTLEKTLNVTTRANMIASAQRLRARPVMTIKSARVATLTLGSKRWSNPEALHRSSATMTDSRI